MYCPKWRAFQPELGEECADPEACQQGWPCEMVRSLQAQNGGKHMAGPHNETNTQKIDPELNSVKEALADWWRENTEQAIEAVVPKAVEYSAIDLMEYGRTLALVMDLGRPISDEEATEIGIWGYLVGKVARWTGAIKEGRRVSQDTIYDIKIYATMAERTRDVGGWPHGAATDVHTDPDKFAPDFD